MLVPFICASLVVCIPCYAEGNEQLLSDELERQRVADRNSKDRQQLLDTIGSLGNSDPHSDSARRAAQRTRHNDKDEDHEDLQPHPFEQFDEHPEDVAAEMHNYTAPTKLHRKDTLRYSVRHPAGARSIRERLQATYCEPAGTGRRDYTAVVSTREMMNEGSDEGRFPSHATGEIQNAIGHALRSARGSVVVGGVSMVLAQTQIVFRHGDRAGMVTTPGAKPARWNCTMPVEPNLDRARTFTASAHASHHPHRMPTQEEAEAVNSAVLFHRYRAMYNDEMCTELGLMGPARAAPPLPPGWGDPLGEIQAQSDLAIAAGFDDPTAFDAARMDTKLPDSGWNEDGTQMADPMGPVSGPLADESDHPDNQPVAAQAELRDEGQRATSRLLQQLGYPVSKRCGAVAAGRPRSMPEPARRGLESEHYRGECVGGQLTPHGMQQAVELGHALRMSYGASNGPFAMGASFVEPLYVQQASERPLGGTGGSRPQAEMQALAEAKKARSEEPDTMHLYPRKPLLRHCFYPGEVSLSSTNYGRTALTLAAVSHGMYATDCQGPKNISGAPGGPEAQDHLEKFPGLSASASRLTYALHPEDDLSEVLHESDWQDDRLDHVMEKADERAAARQAAGLPPLSEEEEQAAQTKDHDEFTGDLTRPSADREGDAWDGSYPSRFISVVPRTADPMLLGAHHDRCPAAKAISDALQHSRAELHRTHEAPLANGLRRIARLGRASERTALQFHSNEIGDEIKTRLCHNYPLPCANGYSDGLPRSLQLQRAPKKAAQRRAMALASDYPCLRTDEAKAALARHDQAYSDYYDGPDTPLLMEKAARAMLRQSQRRAAELQARAALGADNEEEAASQPIGPPEGDITRATERMSQDGEEWRTALYLAADGPMDESELEQAETLGLDLLDHYDGDALMRRLRRGSSLPRNMSVEDAKAWLGLRAPGAAVEHRVGKAAGRLQELASQALPGIYLPEAVQPHVVLRAAHDTVIYPLLATLGYHPGKQPGYVSRVTMETWRAGAVVRGKKGTGKSGWSGRGRADLRAGESYVRVLYDGVDITPHLPCARDTARILRSLGAAARVEDSRAESIAMGHDNHRDAGTGIHDSTVHQEGSYMGEEEHDQDADARSKAFGGRGLDAEEQEEEDLAEDALNEEGDDSKSSMDSVGTPATGISQERLKSKAERELHDVRENEQLAWARHVTAHSALARHSEWPATNGTDGNQKIIGPREVLERLQKLNRRSMAAAGFCLLSTLEAHLDRQLMIGALAAEEAKARTAQARSSDGADTAVPIIRAPLSFADEAVGPNESVDDHLQARLEASNHRLAARKGDWYAACGLHSPPLEAAEELDAIAKSRVSPMPVGGDLDIRDERTVAMPPLHGHRLASAQPRVHPSFLAQQDEDGMGSRDAGASPEEGV